MGQPAESERAQDGVARDDHVTRAMRETDSPDNERAARRLAGVMDLIFVPLGFAPGTKTGWYVILGLVAVLFALFVANTAGWI